MDTTETTSTTGTGDTVAGIAASLESTAGGAVPLAAAVADTMGKPAPTDAMEQQVAQLHERVGSIEQWASGIYADLPSASDVNARIAALEDFGHQLIAAFDAHFGGKIALPAAPSAPIAAAGPVHP